MNTPLSSRCDRIGLRSRWRPGDRLTRLWGVKKGPPAPPPGGVDLRIAPVCEPASDAFTPEELAARLEVMAERHAAGLAADPDRGGITCWACGASPPSRSGNRLRTSGWQSRGLDLIGYPKLREVYCPDCFARWGWPAEGGAA